MARKRVNVKFLIVLTLIVLVGGGAVVAVKLFKGRQTLDPTALIKVADQHAAEKNWDEALRYYSSAAELQPQNVELLIKAGDAANELTRTNPMRIQSVRSFYNKVLEVDPNNLAASQRLLKVSVDEMELMVEVNQVAAEVFTRVRDFSDKVLKQAPDYELAEFAGPASWVYAWLASVETPGTQLDEATAKLATFGKKYPNNARAPWLLAASKLRRGQELVSSNPADAAVLFAETVATMEDAIAASKDQPLLKLYAARLNFGIAIQDSKNRDAHLARGAQLITEAAAEVKVENPSYVQIQLAYADLLRSKNETAKVAALIRKLSEQKGEDPRVRLAMAQFVLLPYPEKLGEAEALLSQPFGQADELVGVRSLVLSDYELKTILLLMGVRLEAARTAVEPRKAELNKLIDDSLQNLNDRAKGDGASEGMLAIYYAQKGKVHQSRAQLVDAIDAFDRAMSIQRKTKNTDFETMFLLAQAYYATGQSGTARGLLEEIVKALPKQLPQARVLLAQVLISENRRDEAKVQVLELEKQTPDDPMVTRLKLALMDRESDNPKMRTEFDGLPEATRPQRLHKAINAMQLGIPDEGERLLKMLLVEDAGDPPAVELLARLYVGQKKIDEALAVVDAAIKAKPDLPALKLLRDAVENPTREQMEKSRLALVDQEKDPLQRELLLFDLARDFGRVEDAMKHLLAAEKIKPDDLRVNEALFQANLSLRKFDEADKYLAVLAKANRDNAGGLVYRFKLAMAKGDANEGLSIGQKLTERLPYFALSWVCEAQALHALGRYDQAIQKYTVGLEKQPNNIDAVRGIIECYYRLEQPVVAKQYLDAASKNFPNDAMFRELQLAHETSYGDPEKAIAAREEALKAAPEEARAWLVLGQTYMRVAQNRATKKDEAGFKAFLAKARTTFTDAYAKWPEDRAFAAFVAETSLLSGDQPAAEQALMRLGNTKAWEARAEPRLMLAQLYARVGKFAEAEAFLRRAVEVSGNDITACRELANFLFQQGKVDEAIASLQPHVGNVDVQRQSIEMLVNAGRAKEAETRVTAALEQSPKDKVLLTLMAIVNLKLNNEKGALEKLNEALAIDPNFSSALYYRGLIKLTGMEADFDSAIRDLTLVREKDPSNVEARFALADAYRRKDDIGNATLELESTLRAIPSSKPARLKLIELYASITPPRWGEVERLINEAKADVQLQSDPDWALSEAQMWLARADNPKAVAAATRAYQLAPGSPQVLDRYLGVLLQTRSVEQIFAVTDKVLADPKARVWWIYRARGVARSVSGDKVGALTELETAFQLAEEAGSEQFKAVVIQTIAQEVGKEKAIAKIAGRAESDPRWLVTIAYLHQTTGDYPGALASIKQALALLAKMEPADQINTLRYAGTLYLTAKPAPMVDEAIVAYQSLLERVPDDLTTLNNLACIYVDNVDPTRPEQALIYSQKAFDLVRRSGMDQPLILDTHGWVLIMNNRVDEGVDLLRQVVERSPFVDAHYHLGEAYLIRQLPEAALQQLQSAQKLIEAAERKKEPVDPSLKAKVEASLTRARDRVQGAGSAQNP